MNDETRIENGFPPGGRRVGYNRVDSKNRKLSYSGIAQAAQQDQP
jgi:hypothetical protein